MAALALLALASPARAQQPTQTPAAVIDGPSPDIVGLSGMSVARDGTGAVVYIKLLAGTPHVFVSRLLAGIFRAPEQVDAGLPGPSSQPVIAAGNGGLLLVGFINAGELYVVTRLSASSAATPPQGLFTGASNPAISISNFGKAYLAFAAAGSGGADVRAAYYNAGSWALESAPLDANPANDAGSGTGAPAITTSGDGVGIVAWGEAGHIYTRRVWGTSPSTVYEQADPASLGGWGEVSADRPKIGTGGDSSFATVVFHAVFSNGSGSQSRVLMRRLHGSQYDGFANADGLVTPAPPGAIQPAVAVSEYGAGFVTSARDDTNAVYAMSLGQNDTSGPVSQVDSLPNASPPDAVTAMAGLYSRVIAWQHDPGPSGTADIRARFGPQGSDLGGELVLSAPALGPTDADSGLAAAGDVSGDAVVAWAQGTASSLAIAVAQLYQPPGSLAPLTRFQYSRTARPALAWSAPRELWGPINYTVALDGAALPATTSTSMITPEPLADGRHSWQATAANPAGLSSTARPSTVFVDTVPPAGRFTISGTKHVGVFLHLVVSYTDAPPPEPPTSASGIALVTVNFGDGSVYRITHGKFHAYTRARRYKVTVTITDRAGNRTTLVQTVKVTPKPKPKPKHKGKGKAKGKPRHARRLPATGARP